MYYDIGLGILNRYQFFKRNRRIRIIPFLLRTVSYFNFFQRTFITIEKQISGVNKKGVMSFVDI